MNRASIHTATLSLAPVMRIGMPTAVTAALAQCLTLSLAERLTL